MCLFGLVLCVVVMRLIRSTTLLYAGRITSINFETACFLEQYCNASTTQPSKIVPTLLPAMISVNKNCTNQHFAHKVYVMLNA